MTDLTYQDAKKRFDEIREEIKKLQLEAEQIMLAHQGQDKPLGKGQCAYHDRCHCEEYHSSGEPAVCGSIYKDTWCGHYASDHAF
ncbi:MAG: hypothetical protein IPI81_11285 [Flavobacteriales bacterium]|nr:hypothetical protein [Flavobacteriales bacterium]MCC6939792.1 hypothetical protein [Flavobacteriales bacterium]